MPRFIRNTVILAKAESGYGTDAAPTGTNAMLVSNLSINPLNAQNVDRSIISGYMGNFEQLVGNRFVECGFDIELVGGGTAGTAPAWDCMMLASGWASAAQAAIRVDYTPVSSSFGSNSIYWYDDGLLHKALGWRGDVTIKMNAGERPVLSFMGKALYTAPTTASNPTPTLTGFKVPLVVTEANTADLTFGGTHATGTAAPSITGGTPYPSLGIEYAHGNAVDHVPLLGGETVEITNRSPSCNLRLDLTATQEASFMTNVASAALSSIGLVHGSTAGYKSLLWLPYVQLVNPTKQELSGKRMVGFTGRVTPSAGNDEARLVLF